MGFLEVLSIIFILAGVIFMLISAIGLVRLPDFYIRNSASTKAATLGLGLILIGTALYFNQVLVFIEILAIFIFIFMITPLAAHIVARSAFKSKTPFWKKTKLDNLEEDAIERKGENEVKGE